jgi:protein-S-isoprenylcysteine O-methyltransferase Ste14
MTLSFWLILLAVLSYGLLHTLLASTKAKQFAHRWFGSKADQWYRLAYNFIAVVTLLPILVLPVLLIDKELYRIPFPWVILTMILQLLAVIAIIVGVKQTGMTSFVGLHQLLLPEDTSPPKMVTGGLYRYVRHPLYTAGLVIIWLMPIMTCNLLALNIGLTGYILVGAVFEERKLLAEFGEEYAAYRQRTPMLVPGLRKPQSKQK